MQIKKTNTFKKLKDQPRSNTPEKIIKHHTGGTDSNPLEDTSHHTAEIVESWHLSKGWDGMGYHYYIEIDGIIWAGRPEHYHGAHTVGQNSISLGICFAGNFDATYPTKAQEEAFKMLYRDITQRYGKAFVVEPHRKYANKTCFGNKLPDDYGQKLADRALEQMKPEIPDEDVKAVDEFLKEENERLTLKNKDLENEIGILRKFIQSLVNFFNDLWEAKK